MSGNCQGNCQRNERNIKRVTEDEYHIKRNIGRVKVPTLRR